MICVRATELHRNTLHTLAPETLEATSLDVVGWFPVVHGPSGRVSFLCTEKMGSPDVPMVGRIDGSSLVDVRAIRPQGEIYGPPLFWSNESSVLYSVDLAGTSCVEMDAWTGRLGSVLSFDDCTPIALAEEDDDRWYLVRSLDRSSIMWASRDLRVSTNLVSGGSLSADYDQSNKTIAVLDSATSLLCWLSLDGSEIGRMNLSEIERAGLWDWFRPIRHGDGWSVLSLGLNSYLVAPDMKETSVVSGTIHVAIDERPRDIPGGAVRPAAGQGAIKDRIEPVLPDGVSGEAKFSLMHTWTSSDVPILVCAGGSWNALGGGQRPNALAREFARMGHATYYHSIGQMSSGISGGICVIAPDDLADAFDTLKRSPGVIMMGLPLYLDHMGPLIDAGWTLIYDMLDNWSGFAKSEGLDPRNVDLEPDLVRMADVVTCSDPRLCERAREMGAPETTLIRNGGPAVLQPRNVPPRDMAADARHLVAYAGHIHGSWFDWPLMREIDRHDDLAITVVGGWIQERYRRTRFIGERDHPDVIRYLAASDVGIIPFCNPEITQYVDPVKAYDYWSAGTWCVCTPELESMVDRPYTIVAERDGFVDAIREASEMRHVDPPTAEWVADNSWESRAKQVVEVVRRFHRDPRQAAIHVRPHRDVVPEETGLRVTIQSPSTCNMYPPCPYCGSHGHWGQETWSRPAGEWLDALIRFFDQHAPVFASACLGETLSDKESLFIWREIAQGHRIELVTNLLFRPSFIDPLPRNGNVVLVTSFHPHKMTIDEFISRRQAVIDSGLDVGRVLVVGWPPNMPQVEGWNDRFSELGWEMELIPFRGMDDGQVFPEAYRGQDLEMIERYLKAVHGRSDLLYGSPRGKRCVAGSGYCCIKWDGDVFGCSTCLFAPRLGNIFSGEPIRLLPEPAACESDSCYCPDLWQFLLDEGESE